MKWPATVTEAVDVLMARLSTEDLADLRTMDERGLIELHFGLGMWIRNHFGLWKENTALLTDCGATHADDASMVIIRALWQRCRSGSHSGAPG